MQELKESEERFRMMANSIPQLAWMTDAKGWIYWYNDRWYEYTGTTPEEMLGWGWTKVHHPDLVDGVVKRFREAIEAGTPWEDTFLLRSKEGEYRWFLSRSKPVRKEDGTLIGWFGTNTDITEQKETEDALKRSESTLRNLVLQAPVAMCIGRGSSFIVEIANDRMLEFWGKRAEEIIGRPVFEVFTEVGEQGLRQVIEQVYATGERFTANEMPLFLPRDGRIEMVYVNFVYEPIKNSDGATIKIVAVATDVTDLVVTRKKIEESHKEFQFAMDFIPQIIWLTWPNGYHYYYNKQWYDYTGLTFGQTKGEGWNQVIHPDDQERAWNKWRHCLAVGEPYEIEYRCRRYDGQYRWFLGRALPLRDETGAIIKWFGTCTDIHDQKTFAEILEKLVDERTRELQRSNEDLQQFAHVASHDLKEPVRKIKTFVGNVQQELDGKLDKTCWFYLDRVQAAATRMLSMIDGVLAYSTISALEEIYELVDLNQVIENVEFDLEVPILRKGAVIHYANLPKLEGAPLMLHQVFYNLISNSLKFARADVAPVITITSAIIEKKGKPFAYIVLEDNGIGFEQKYAEKIFGTFTRLHSKDKYEGAGLGLSLCKKIIERHGGSITAKAANKGGAVFEIVLPVERASD